MRPEYYPALKPEVYAVTRDLEVLDTWQIAKPGFPRLNTFFKGMPGRSMECFADGTHYKYAEWSDAVPLLNAGTVPKIDPVFFVKREQDIGRGPGVMDRHDQIREYPNNSGIWAIDSTIRMIVYSGLAAEWDLPNGIKRIGIAVVSNLGVFPARTAVAPFFPIGAANGYIYHKADPEILSDGDLGNPLILRYKFIPPPDANP